MRLLPLVLLLTVAAGTAAEPLQPAGDKKAPAAANRERWAKLPPQKKKQIEELYRRLLGLSPRDRDLVLERLRAMDPRERRKLLREAQEEVQKGILEQQSRRIRREWIEKQLEKMPQAEKDRLKGLSIQEQKKYLQAKIRKARERSIGRLPPPLQEKVRSMPPGEQAEFLRGYHGEQVFKETFRNPEEVKQLRALPLERIAGLLGQGTKGPARPAFLSDETWNRWLELKPYEKARALRVLIGPKSKGPSPQGQKMAPQGKKMAPPGKRPPTEKLSPPKDENSARS